MREADRNTVCRQVCQLHKVRGKEAGRVRGQQRLTHGPCKGYSIRGACGAAQLIYDDQAVCRSMVKDVGHFLCVYVCVNAHVCAAQLIHDDQTVGGSMAKRIEIKGHKIVKGHKIGPQDIQKKERMRSNLTFEATLALDIHRGWLWQPKHTCTAELWGCFSQRPAAVDFSWVQERALQAPFLARSFPTCLRVGKCKHP
eukprot:1138859-Pelagomonas_calceolata.AAC.11